MKTIDEIRQFLTDDGWQKSQSLGREIWCKRFDAPRCKCNDDKHGIQAVVVVHEPMDIVQSNHSFEIDVTGEKPDGVWVKLMAYGIGCELPDVLHDQVNQPVKAWTVLALMK